jgi:predicted nuclease of predicted toxin-antitoxin system
MKLLFDENLSPKLVQALADLFPDSTHVDRIGLGGGADNDVWEYAKEHGFTLVSKDSDFYDKSMLSGHPPKVIWIKRGNCTNRQIQLLLRNKVESISAFFADEQVSFICIT